MQNDIHFDVHGATLRGDDHAENHDHFAIADLNKSLRVHQTNLALEDDSRVVGRTQGHVYLVADGISGGPAPADASSTAVDSIVRHFLNDMPWAQLIDGSPRDVTLALEQALQRCERELRERGGPRGMGTTLTLAFIAWPDLHIAHVGDSRCYLARAGELRQLTTDHTLSQVRKSLGAEPSQGDENVLWNAVGGGPASELQPEVLHCELRADDALLLCTDGALAVTPPEQLAELLASSLPAAELAERIVSGRGDDDRTAVVVRCARRARGPVPVRLPEPVPDLDTGAREPLQPQPPSSPVPHQGPAASAPDAKRVIA